MDHNFPTGNSKINIPHFCSRNSGLVFEDIVGYRVYLGHCDKLPDTHFLSIGKVLKNLLKNKVGKNMIMFT